METNSKIYLEYYNGKYCKFPDNITCQNTHGDNFVLAGWVVYNKSTSKFLTFNKDMDPVYSGFIFNGEGSVSGIKDLVILEPGSTVLENMEVNNDEPHDHSTLSDLQSSDIEFKPLFREKLWVKITSKRLGDSIKVYNSDSAIIGSGKFTIKELGDNDLDKSGYIWQGYFLGNKKVDANTVFEESEAGSHIVSIYKSKPVLTIMWKDEKVKEISVDPGEFEIGRLPVKHGYQFEGVYNNPNCEGDKLSILNITEDTTLYAKYSKEVYIPVYVNNNIVDLIHGYEGYNAQSSIEYVRSELVMYNCDVDGFYYDETYQASIGDPFILPDQDKRIYVKCKPKEQINVTVRDFILNQSSSETVIPSYVITGVYNAETESYVFRDIKWRVNDYGFIEFGSREHVIDYSKFYRAKRDEHGLYISINHKDTYALELIPKYAKDIQWRIKNVLYNPINMTGSIMSNTEFDEIFTIPFDTESGNKYFSSITLNKYDNGDFIEKDSELALDGRVFSDINCTTKILSPVLDGNNVELYYFGSDDIKLPIGYRKVDKKDNMSLRIVDCGEGKIEPNSFIISTGQTITLNKNMFNCINAPEGLVFSHFSYTRPDEDRERNINIGDDLIMDRSIDMIAHWDKPITATFMVDGKLHQELISDNPNEFTFTLPAMPYKPNYAFQGWDNTDKTSGEITIKESTVFNAVFYPVDLL